jgi:AdoMet-dependent heme synthase
MAVDTFLEILKREAFENGQKSYFYWYIAPVIKESCKLSKKYGASEEISASAAFFYFLNNMNYNENNSDKRELIAAEILEKVPNLIEEQEMYNFLIGTKKGLNTNHPENLYVRILRSAEGITRIKYPFFALREQECPEGVVSNGLYQSSIIMLNNAFDEIYFKAEKDDMFPLYQTRKSIISKAQRGKMDFCLFLVPCLYTKVVWEITQKCNLKCVHCCNGEPKAERVHRLEGYRKGIMDMKLVAAVDEIYFTGGEPFCLPFFVDILEYAGKAGILCSVATNGTLLSDEIAERVSNVGLNMLQVSFDGPDEAAHDLVRGAGSFKHTIKSIKKVTNICKLRMSSVVLKHTQNRIEDFVSLALGLGADEVIFNWPRRVGRLKQDLEFYPTLPEDEFLMRCKGLIEKYRGRINVATDMVTESYNQQEGLSVCPGGKRIIFVTYKGKVAPCSWIHKTKPNFTSKSSIFKEGFRKCYLEMNEFQDLVKSRKNNGFEGCPFIALQKAGIFMAQDPRFN